MILSLEEYDVMVGLNNINFNQHIPIYSGKPSREIDWAYIWISITSDTPKKSSNIWYLEKEARISLNIIWPLHVPEDNTSEGIISYIINTITNAIVDEHHPKNIDWNGKSTVSCKEWPIWPMLYSTKDRAMRVKDYFITYHSIDNG